MDNIASTFGHKAALMLAHDAAVKAALEQRTRCWALERAPSRIVPLGRRGTAELKQYLHEESGRRNFIQHNHHGKTWQVVMLWRGSH